MPLRLYLDDCAAGANLRDLLHAAGHVVVIPAEAGIAGQVDEVHFRYAIDQNLVLVTMNTGDFAELHDANPKHPGIVLIYQDNDAAREMRNADTVQAFELLEQAYQGIGLANELHVLNRWRSTPSATGASPTTPKKGKKGRPRK